MFKWFQKNDPISMERTYVSEYKVPDGFQPYAERFISDTIIQMCEDLAKQYVEEHKVEIIQGININNITKNLNNEVEKEVMKQYLGKLVTK